LIDPDPVGAGIVYIGSSKTDPVGKTVPLELGEPHEDRSVLVGILPTVMADPRIFRIFNLGPRFFEALGPLAHSIRLDDGIGPALEKMNRQVERVRRKVRGFPRGAGQTGAIAAQTSGLVSPSQSVPPPPIDSRSDRLGLHLWEALFDVGQHVIDVLFGDALIAHRPPGERRSDDGGDVRPFRKIAGRLDIRFHPATLLFRKHAQFSRWFEPAPWRLTTRGYFFLGFEVAGR